MTSLITRYTAGSESERDRPQQGRSASPRRYHAPNRRAYAAATDDDQHGETQSDTPSRLDALDAASLGLVLPESTPDDLFPPPLNVFAHAAQAGTGGTNRRRPATYFRPVNDSVVSKTLPPSPCKVCGSAKHWDRECPHWEDWLAARSASQAMIAFDIHPTEDVEYARAYLDSNRYSVHMSSARELPLTEASPIVREQPTHRRVSVSDVEETDTDLPRLPSNHPCILLPADEDPDVAAALSTQHLADRIDAALAAADEASRSENLTRPAESTRTEARAAAASTGSPLDAGGTTEERPSMEHTPAPPSGPRILRMPKARLHVPGHSTVGISALCVPVQLASTSSLPVVARMDSGADISLISEDCLNSIPADYRPRIQKGLRMKLFQLTNGFRIEGFVQLPVLVQADDGDWLSFDGEFYVVPGMTSVILLGEDFQVSYELGVRRSAADGSSVEVHATGHTFEASSATTTSSRPFGIIGRGAAASFVRAKSHRRNAYRRKLRRRADTLPTARANADYTIQPHSCRPIPVTANFQRVKTWFAEKTVLGQQDGSCLLTTPTMLDERHAFVAVSNPTERPVRINRGESLCELRDPNSWFDQPSERYAAHAQAIHALIEDRLAQGVERDVPEEEDNWGPKTADLPDPTIYPSEQMEELLDIGPEWPPEERTRLLDVLRARQGAFVFDGRLGHNATEVEIKVAPGTRPVSLPMYAASPAKRAVIDGQHDAWMAMDVIEPSTSPWAAPVLIAYRNGKPRFCVDYRRLNAATVPDEFPIPRQTEILQALSGAQVLSSLDALSGFTQLTVAEGDREKTAFRTHRGLFQFRRLPFGLRNGPSAFQRVMQGVLAPYLWLFTLVYIDDIVIFSRTWAEHVEHLDKVLAAIIGAGLTLSPAKCHFGYTSILLLGQKVSRLGFSTHEEKVRAVAEFARPTKVAELQSFLGMTVYFANYIPYYSFMASPLFLLLRKETQWEWTAECEHAWQSVKAALQAAPILAHATPGLPYRLYTDASDYALGACLQQVQLTRVADLRGTRAYDRLQRAFQAGAPVPPLVAKISTKFSDVPPEPTWATEFEDTLIPVERVVAYWSRSCKPAERNYSATEREALAAKEGLVHFLPFIEGEDTTLITDHAALQWARTFENANRRLAAWGAVFSAFAPHLNIVHRAGRVHSNVDPLSRILRQPPAHDSPVWDSSESIVSRAADLPTGNARAKQPPASRTAAAGSALCSWFDVVEDVPLRAFGLPSGGTCDATLWDDACVAAATTRSATRRRANAPSPPEESPPPRTEPEADGTTYTILFEPGEELVRQFVDGYQKDAFFRDKWDKTRDVKLPQFQGQSFQTDQRGLLYMRVEDEEPRLCVPTALVPYVLAHIHDSPLFSAHEGPRKLAQKVRLRFYWPNLRKDARAYAETCDVCQKVKADRRAKAGFLRPNPIPTRPYEWVSMDLITGLPAAGPYNAIFVTVCRLTKHVQCIPCNSSLDTTGFAQLFVDNVILRYGIPSHIISDRDTRWTSAFWRAVAQRLDIHLSLSSTHHPQHDGQTEVVNQTIKTMLRAYVREDRTEWARWLPLVCHAYNASVHSATGYTPYFLLFGMEPSDDLDMLTHLAPHVARPRGPLEHAYNFLHDLELHRDQARAALAIAREQAARAYNKGRRAEVFEPGDMVLVNPHSLELVDVRGTGKKLVQRMLGPFQVQERINPLVYKLALPDTYPMNPVLNIAHLKRYRRDEAEQFTGVSRPQMPDPRNSDVLASQEWEVEDLVAWRRNRSLNNRLEFLIRWKGYGPTEDSWASEADLRNAQELLREFRACHPASRD